MVAPTVGLIYDDRMLAHCHPSDSFHPETPPRLTAIMNRLKSDGVLQRCVQVEAREATYDELSSVHTKEHIDLMHDVSGPSYGKERRRNLAREYDSIYFNEGSSKAALLAAGSVVEIALRVAQSELASGVAVVRPPGHHAEAGKAMGFCLFNNVAIAADVLLQGKKELGIRKILIVDWDVHHGNGTQRMFWNNSQVLYFSVHRYDGGSFYPRSDEGNYDKLGEGDGAGFNINVPWPHGGFGDADYLAVWDYLLMPVAERFNPDIVLISSGFDAAKGDPLGGCQLTPSGYSLMTKKLMNLAEGRVVIALEGGYNLNSIANCCLACVKALFRDPVTEDLSVSKPFPHTWTLIKQVRERLKTFWPILGESNNEIEMQLQDSTLVLNQNQILDSRDGNVSEEEEVLTCIGDKNRKNDDFFFPNKQIEDVPSRTINESVTDLIDKIALLSTEGKSDRENDDYAMVNRLSGTDSSSSASDTEFAGNCHLNLSLEEDNSEYRDAIFSMDVKIESSYVWYASYGSNIWKPRFMCYLQGGQVDGMLIPCAGSRDQTPPVATEWLVTSYQLFFGRSYTSTWGKGGVAFLDLNSKEGVLTHAHLYKITLEQFTEVMLQENVADLNTKHALLDTVCKVISTPSIKYAELIKDGWYGTVLHLGAKDGSPILTFTCSPSQIDMFNSGLLPIVPPCEAYQRVIARGLMEHNKSSEAAALSYISSNSI